MAGSKHDTMSPPTDIQSFTATIALSDEKLMCIVRFRLPHTQYQRGLSDPSYGRLPQKDASAKPVIWSAHSSAG
jgi:hypothetical protein